MRPAATHQAQGSDTGEGQGHQAASPAGAKAGGSGTPVPALPPNVAYDLSLQHPRCVYQLLKQQYSRYTPEMVERITGIPKDQFLKAADLFTSVRKDGDMKKVATIIYAVGWTQHSFGTQIIRTAAMLQLADGKRRARRRRRQCAARPLQHSGRDRHGRHLRHPSRLSQDAEPGRQGFRRPTSSASRPQPPSRIRGSRSITGRTRRSSRCRS